MVTRRMRLAFPYLFLLGLVLAIYGDVLFFPGEWIASSGTYDARAYCAPVRGFGYEQLRNGHLPLWNPHMYSGAPFLAGFQSALLYPANIHYLFLPLAKSMNVEMALHVYLLGAFMYAWARGRRLEWWSALFAAIVVMFSSLTSLRLMAGHLAYVNAMAWSPLILLAIDKTVELRKMSWACIGALALSMSILAGHPQAVFCTLAIAVPYAAVRWIYCEDKYRNAAYLAFLFVSPAFLAAAQLWPALYMANEGVRAGGLKYAIASTMSIPPENLLTSVAPDFFGNSVSSFYWGRWVFWEVCAFIGVTTLTMAAYAMVATPRPEKYLWASLALFALVLSLGRYTPVYHLLYLLPGVDSFRGPSRHFLGVVLFMGMLAGAGAETFARERRYTKIAAATCGIVATWFLLCAACVYFLNTRGLWERVLLQIQQTAEAYWRMEGKPVGAAAMQSAVSLLIAAGVFAVLATAFGLSSKNKRFAYAAPLIGAIEMLVFFAAHRESFDRAAIRKPALENALRSDISDHRVFDMAQENYPMEIGESDIWGYDPTASRRYAQLMAYTQGADVEDNMTEFTFRQYHPIFRMLRCSYIIESRQRGEIIQSLGSTLPRALLLSNYRVISDETARLSFVSALEFDPDSVVVLEEEPQPKPAAGLPSGHVSWTDESTDAFVVEVDTPSAAILLITDAYARDWHATGLGVAPQPHYTIMPANHVLRALPLSPGRHRIRIEYSPAAFGLGMKASIASTLIMTMAASVSAFRKLRLNTWDTRN